MTYPSRALRWWKSRRLQLAEIERTWLTTSAGVPLSLDPLPGGTPADPFPRAEQSKTNRSPFAGSPVGAGETFGPETFDDIQEECGA